MYVTFFNIITGGGQLEALLNLNSLKNTIFRM